MEHKRPPLEKPQAVILDVTGTLIPPNSNTFRPNRKTAATIKEAQKLIPVTLLTGSTHRELAKDVFLDMKPSGVYGAVFGAQILTPDGEFVAGDMFSRADVETITETLGGLKVEFSTHHLMKDGGIQRIDDPSSVYAVTLNRDEYLEKVYPYHKKPSSPLFHADHNPKLGIVTIRPDVKGNKALGVTRIAQELGVDPKQIITIGDDMPDIGMFETSGFGIAVRNAREEVKEKADFVVPDVGMNNVAYALKRFVLEPHS